LRLPDEPFFSYLAILRTETNDTDAIARMLSGNRTLFEYNRSIGGTLYPFAAVEMTQSDWRRHYGPAWPALVNAKQRYDRAGVFASGPDLRWGSGTR
jgi:FAD/FMN-containing dehydrogenase